MPTKKQLLIGAGVGIAVGGAIIAYKLSRKDHEDEDAFTAKVVVPPTPAPAAAAAPAAVAAAAPAKSTDKSTTGAAAAAAAAPASSSEMLGGAQETSLFTREYSFRPNDVNEAMLEEALAEEEARARAAAATGAVANADGSYNFEHMRLSITPPAGWIASSELSPMPNVAMVTVAKPDFAERQARLSPDEMGTIPVIVLSAEDISAENLNIKEFADKSKHMAEAQMGAMTGGMMRPQVTFDDVLSVGPFERCIEFEQRMPPYFELAVTHLIAVRGGFAYVFQMMCSPRVLKEYKPAFLEMARSVRIAPAANADAYTSFAFSRVYVPSAGVQFDAHPSWQWAAPGLGASVADLTTAASTKREVLSVYRSIADVPATTYTVKSERKTSDGVTVATLVDGRQQKVRLTNAAGFVVIVSPQQKPESYLPEGVLIAFAKSVAATAVKSDDGSAFAEFVHAQSNYRFPLQRGGKVIATPLGAGTIVYAPNGVPENPEQAMQEADMGPTVTVRTGRPETDPDCAKDLDEWEANMRAETKGSLSGFARVKLAGGRDCFTFVSKDMHEIGPGESQEMMGKVFIFSEGGTTTLVRWETPTGLWRKFERKMDQFMNGFTFTA